MSKESRDTVEQLFYVVSVMAVILGGILWLASMNEMASANASDIHQLKTQNEDHAKEFEEIRTRLTRIEDAVGANKQTSRAHPRNKGE